MYEEQQPGTDNNGFSVQISNDEFSNNGSELSLIIDGLLRFTNYDCNVTASTSVGEGMQSTISSNRTDEAGNN